MFGSTVATSEAPTPSTTGRSIDHKRSLPRQTYSFVGQVCTRRCRQSPLLRLRQSSITLAKSDNGTNSNGFVTEWPPGSDWATGFPSYLQRETQQTRDDQFCEDIEDTFATADVLQGLTEQAAPLAVGLFDPVSPRDEIWEQVRDKAEEAANEEPILSSFMYSSVLSHDSFDKALAFVLSNRLGCTTLLAPQLNSLFREVIAADDLIRISCRADIQAVKGRDPACKHCCQALLYFKGYQALQSYRIANHLWKTGRTLMAYALQSRMSEVFSVDIHPAATIGMGVLMDHATGLVIGETAVVGNNVSILHGVTLGGTGKESGDRHPKVGSGVLIGASAKILGNITIGKGSMIAAGSLVLKPVKQQTMVAGTPAKVVGQVRNSVPALTMKQEVRESFCQFWSNAVAEADAERVVQVHSAEMTRESKKQNDVLARAPAALAQGNNYRGGGDMLEESEERSGRLSDEVKDNIQDQSGPYYDI